MRSSRFVTCFVAFATTCATAACTGLLGNYQVSDVATEAGAPESGSTNEGGPSTEAGAGDTSVPADGPTDSPLVCASPLTACENKCVNLETDKDNCQRCGRSCLGGTCVAHVCQPFLAYPRPGVAAKTLEATDTDLFFATTSWKVVQQPVAAGAAAIDLATALGQVFAITTLKGATVFFTAQNADGTTWDVWKATTGMAGSGAEGGGMYGGTPVGLVAAGNLVHTAQVLPGSPESFQIASCPQTGAGCNADAAGPGIPGSRMAAGGGNIFWTDQMGSVFAMPDTGGARTPIGAVSTEGTATAASFDGATLFWVQNNSAVVRKSAYPMPAPMTVRSIGSSANDMVVDATNIYYAQFIAAGKPDNLYVMPKSGAVMPVVIATGKISRLAQTSTGVYWAEADGIHVIAKP